MAAMHEPREIDRDSPVAPYRQIAADLQRAIEAGEYRPGQRLPSRDDIAQIWGVAKDTALKAQRELIKNGWAELSPGIGTFVRSDLPR
jgi:DNA-binding GntR family transcriptional regulator